MHLDCMSIQFWFFGTLRAFSAFEEKMSSTERRQLFQLPRRSGVSRVSGEKVAAKTENLVSHTHRTTTIPSLLTCGGEGNDNDTA